jgi:hypothetical protein
VLWVDAEQLLAARGWVESVKGSSATPSSSTAKN